MTPPEQGPLQERCLGDPPLQARLEPWMRELASEPAGLDELLREHGSPLNLHRLEAFARNAAEIEAAAAERGIEIATYFARKANKCLAFVEEAARLGLGVDVAGERELAQTLEAGVEPGRIVLTAAIKPASALRLCLRAGVPVAIDNRDELELLSELAAERGGEPHPVALRLTPSRLGSERPRSRFGLDAAQIAAAGELIGVPTEDRGGLRIAGLHFHLDGYTAADRVATIGEALELIDGLRAGGHSPAFLDIGGGFPISYLERREQWEGFWREQRRALRGSREPLTFDGDGLGLRSHEGEIAGEPETYPYWQEPVRGQWLGEILAAPAIIDGRAEPVAEALRRRRIELRCEPGRALLDGCGASAARVEFVKPYESGTHLVGVAMNRTQCRTASGEPQLDPLLLPGPGRDPRGAGQGEGLAGFLVGAYCIERELLSRRRLRFPQGVERGDIVLFPNTAGYFMHILESSSHQMPLARNLILDRGEPGAPPEATLDGIDAHPAQL